MKTVLSAGVFDFFHPGHRFFLESAKKLGDRLVVIVARDKNVKRIKKLTPEHSEDQRKQHIQDYGIADVVLLGNEEGSFLDIVHKINPDILAVGYDQKIPDSFTKLFPDVQIVNITSKNPDMWKSSKYRGGK